MHAILLTFSIFLCILIGESSGQTCLNVTDFDNLQNDAQLECLTNYSASCPGVFNCATDFLDLFSDGAGSIGPEFSNIDFYNGASQGDIDTMLEVACESLICSEIKRDEVLALCDPNNATGIVFVFGTDLEAMAVFQDLIGTIGSPSVSCDYVFSPPPSDSPTTQTPSVSPTTPVPTTENSSGSKFAPNLFIALWTCLCMLTLRV